MLSAAAALTASGLRLASVTDNHLAIYAVIAVVLGYGALAGLAYYLLHDRPPKERGRKGDDDGGSEGS